MGVVRIQDLTAATTPLSGTEIVEIEQGGNSRKVAVSEIGGGLANPMTTAEDLIKGGASGAPARLGVGSNGQVLTVTAGAVGWATPSSGGAVPVQEEGSTVVASPTAINFVGAGATVTDVGGVATVTIPGGGGGGGSTLESIVWTASAIPSLGTNAITVYGIDTSPTGSRFAGSRSSTSRYRSNAYVSYTQNTVSGWRTNGGSFSRGSGGGGGFKGRMIFAPNEGVAISAHRFFIGMRSGVTPSDVDPSTLSNIIGIGYDSADTQVQLFHNDAVGTATKVALGASFPKPSTTSSVIYDLVLTCLPSASDVSYLLTEHISGATTSGTLSADIPAVSVSLEFAAYISQGGGTATTTQIDMFGAYFQTRQTL